MHASHKIAQLPEIIHALAAPDCLVTVTADLVRDRVKLSSTDIEDAKVTDFIKDVEAAIEEESGVSIDYTNCSHACKTQSCTLTIHKYVEKF